jgi:O-antigen/teichoic acid export membrane protein
VADTPPTDPTDELEAPGHLERLVRIGVLWKFVAQAGAQMVRLATVVILARLLRPGDYGVAALAIALAAFAPTLGDMGMGSALVQTERATRVVRSTAFWGALAFGGSLSALLAIAALPVGRFVDDPRMGTMMSVGALSFAIYSVGATHQAMLVRTMNFRAVDLRFVLALVVAGATAVTAASMGMGSWALVLQQLVLMTAFTSLLWWRASWHPTLDFSTASFRQLSAFAVRIAGGRWARLAELIVLSILIARLVGVEDLGAWTFAMSTVILPLTIIAIPIAEVLFSAFSRMRGDPERISGLWIESIGVLAAVILPLLVGLVVVAPDLIPLVFGAQWRVAVPIVQILSVSVILRCLQAWSSVILDAAGRPQVTLRTQLVALCLTPVAVVVGSHWGIEGVAVGFVVAQLIAVEIPVFVLTLSELQLSPGRIVRRLAGVALATLCMAIACLAVRLGLVELNVGVAVRVAATIALGAIVYSAALWILAPDIRQRGMGLISKSAARARVLATRTSES